MKVYGVLFMSAGYAEKSADGQAIKRIQTLGKKFNTMDVRQFMLRRPMSQSGNKRNRKLGISNQ